MFDIYESYKTLSLEGVEPELITQFAAWCVLGDVRQLNEPVKLAFLDDLLHGEGDLLERILQRDEDQKSLLWFWRADLSRAAFDRVPPAVTENQRHTFLARRSLDDLAHLLGLAAAPEGTVLHLTDTGKRDIKFYFFVKAGPILIADLAVADSEETAYDYAGFFKTLADDTRLTLIRALAAGPRTQSELAEIGGISLPTVTHHLKRLIEYRLVALRLDSKEGRNAEFVFNQEACESLLSRFADTL